MIVHPTKLLRGAGVERCPRCRPGEYLVWRCYSLRLERVAVVVVGKHDQSQQTEQQHRAQVHGHGQVDSAEATS